MVIINNDENKKKKAKPKQSLIKSKKRLMENTRDIKFQQSIVHGIFPKKFANRIASKLAEPEAEPEPGADSCSH